MKLELTIVPNSGLQPDWTVAGSLALRTSRVGVCCVQIAALPRQCTMFQRTVKLGPTPIHSSQSSCWTSGLYFLLSSSHSFWTSALYYYIVRKLWFPCVHTSSLRNPSACCFWQQPVELCRSTLIFKILYFSASRSWNFEHITLMYRVAWSVLDW